MAMVTKNTAYFVTAYGGTDIGCVRSLNEDVWGKIPEICFFVLADGMGGHQGGDVASQMAVEFLCDYMKGEMHGEKPSRSLSETSSLISSGIDYVNRKIWEQGTKHPSLKGMGTTLCCVQFHKEGLIYAHVGDSRIYRMRNKKIESLTRDHSLLSDLIDMGQLSEQEARHFTYKNIITRAVGTEPTIAPSISSTSIEHRDLFLMCTDGLSDLLSANEIEQIVNDAPTIEIAVMYLIDQAKKAGGHDNITVVAMQVHEFGESSETYLSR